MDVNFERLEHLCHEKGITIAELERESGLGNSTIRKWKVDNNSPRLDNLHIIANYLDTTVSYLIGETDNPSKRSEKILDQWTGEVMGKLHVYEISCKTLADKLGWHEKYLSAVLNGHRKPKKAEAQVMQALNELIQEKENSKSEPIQNEQPCIPNEQPSSDEIIWMLSLLVKYLLEIANKAKSL